MIKSWRCSKKDADLKNKPEVLWCFWHNILPQLKLNSTTWLPSNRNVKEDQRVGRFSTEEASKNLVCSWWCAGTTKEDWRKHVCGIGSGRAKLSNNITQVIETCSHRTIAEGGGEIFQWFFFFPPSFIFDLLVFDLAAVSSFLLSRHCRHATTIMRDCLLSRENTRSGRWWYPSLWYDYACFVLCYLLLCRVMLSYLALLSCVVVLSCLMLSCLVLSCIVVLSYLALTCLVFSFFFFVLPCVVLCCLVLFCVLLSRLSLSLSLFSIL
jgi:hypothetical protein